MTKKIVISGYYGFNNFGDEAILSLLIQNLKAMDTDLTVISKNPEQTKKLYDVKAIQTFNLVQLINLIEKSDILISGGGSLLQDVTSIRSLLYYLFIILIAATFGKKIIIFSQGIGPIKNPIARFIAKKVLKKCDYISVRDDKSLLLLRGWGFEPDLVVDPLFSINLPKNMPLRKVGVQLRKCKGVTDKFLLELAKALVEEFKGYEFYIYCFQNSQDFDISKTFESYLFLFDTKVRTKLILNENQFDIINSMRDLEYMVAMRFHACLVALKYSIPTLALNYDIKVEKLAQNIQIPYVGLDESEKIVENLRKIRFLNRRKIEQNVEKYKFDFDKIKKIIESSL